MGTRQILFTMLLGLGFVGSCRKVEPTRPAARDFSRNPPGIESATIRPLPNGQPGGNAVLEVRFEQGDSSVQQGVSIYPRGKEIVLRDDGSNGDSTAHDGVFSAIVDFDFAELGKDVARGAALKSNTMPQIIFRGREVIGIEDTAMVRGRLARFAALRDINNVISARMRINLFDLVPAVDPMSMERWLQKWNASQPVTSGFNAAPRGTIQTRIINPWPRTGGKLDLDHSPFRLAAIVNRIDLGDNPAYGGRGSAGEGRFIFGVQNRDSGTVGCQFLPFSVIFEYGIPKHTCPDVRAWALRWVALSSLPLGSATYNDSLEKITEVFVRANADPAKPNGSALNQLRTNENALDPLWELREFAIDSATHQLKEVTTKQTTDETLNTQPVIATYVNANAPAIKLDKHVVPDHFPGATDPFMAATSRATPTNQLNTHFRATGIVDNDARFHFSLNTCSACHIRETQTPFLHVDPRPMPAQLSRFMTGLTPSITDSPDLFFVVDPVVGLPTTHPFNDLDRRRKKLASIAGSSCFRIILVPPRHLFEELPPIPPRGPLPVIRDPRLNGLNDPLRMTH
ncbi:MAG: hypothetical protein DMD40_15315 [Gemmatimonadetes bacterium]|nr:MAG: hypothetical protein DMD40_15315 [Gemmatimonadota bacterium]